MRVTAVVVTHNRPAELKRVIESLRTQIRPVDRIVVVDNAAEPPAVETLGRYRDIRIVKTPTNLGGAGGFAFGLTAALDEPVDWIWLLDDDAIPRAYALDALVRALPDLPAETAVLSSTVFEDGSIAREHQRLFYPRSGHEPALPEACYSMPMTEIDLASFVGFFVKSSVVNKVGLPDRRFFISYDDTEYSLRIRAHGGRIWHVRNSEIDHLKLPSSRLQLIPFGERHYYDARNRIIVAGRYSEFPTFAQLRATREIVRLFRVTPKQRLRSELLWLWHAIRDGWQQRLGRYDVANASSDRLPLFRFLGRSSKVPTPAAEK